MDKDKKYAEILVKIILKLAKNDAYNKHSFLN